MSDRPTISAMIRPLGSLEMLSREEINQLHWNSQGGCYELFRQCTLAILNTSSTFDNAKLNLERYSDFAVRIHPQARGIALELQHAPADAFVDGQMIQSTHEMIFSALRDVLFTQTSVRRGALEVAAPGAFTEQVFQMLRHASALPVGREPRMVVCWGGHSISRDEYDYSKNVGHELGLRGLDIGTGCGPGAMKGPMKGATIGHAKQRIQDGRYLGLTEPGIIAAEPPNPIVNELVILPDIEKRLEAFLRVAHGIVIFPGGVGTAEELLYLLGILLQPDNIDITLPVVLTAPQSAQPWLAQIHAFIGATLGPTAQQRYQIIVDDAEAVAQAIKTGIAQVAANRRATNDAYYFNWHLNIDPIFQQPFQPNHHSMRALDIHRDLPTYVLAANLRRVFSGIVAGNVKDDGIRAIEQHGPFDIHAEAGIMKHLDALLAAFVADHRMKLPGTGVYQPCYRLLK